MEIETNSPEVAARHIMSRFNKGLAAEVTYPAKKPTRIWFFPVALLGDLSNGGIIVACERGGAVQFDHPTQVNRFACIRGRMPGWAATFVADTLSHLMTLKLERPVTGNEREQSRNEIKNIGDTNYD